MKKYIIAISILLGNLIFVFGQNGMNYQGLLLDSDGNGIAERTAIFTISITQTDDLNNVYKI